MFIDPNSLTNNLDILEEIEKASLRMVTQAVYLFRHEAAEIFAHESDLAGDIGEDITREALDSMGVSKAQYRLFGKVDYKRARYVFHPNYAIQQALFIDSKAEKINGHRTATIQTSQTSMDILQIRGGTKHTEHGKLPRVIDDEGDNYLVTTIFVKYNYSNKQKAKTPLQSITISCIPNGMLQQKYNPTVIDTIWLAGRDAPSRGEAFRVRLSYQRLEDKMPWRVQQILVSPMEKFDWRD